MANLITYVKCVCCCLFFLSFFMALICRWLRSCVALWLSLYWSCHWLLPIGFWHKVGARDCSCTASTRRPINRSRSVSKIRRDVTACAMKVMQRDDSFMPFFFLISHLSARHRLYSSHRRSMHSGPRNRYLRYASNRSAATHRRC